MDILERNMVPFPYKTAKALDGTHYRNLPQDVWTELVKGQLGMGIRLPSWARCLLCPQREGGAGRCRSPGTVIVLQPAIASQSAATSPGGWAPIATKTLLDSGAN